MWCSGAGAGSMDVHAMKEVSVHSNLYLTYDLADELRRDAMARAEQAAELQRVLPNGERRHLPGIHFHVPGIRRRARLAASNGC